MDWNKQGKPHNTKLSKITGDCSVHVIADRHSNDHTVVVIQHITLSDQLDVITCVATLRLLNKYCLLAINPAVATHLAGNKKNSKTSFLNI